MIISHKYKYIFIKTQKTAGTSIEIALSKFCGDHDIISPIMLKDERHRQKLGYRGPQNYRIPFSRYSARDWARLVFRGKLLAFYGHASAKFIQQYVESEVWAHYFKFAFVRNPWDRAISWYFWKNPNDPKPSFSEFLKSDIAHKIRGYKLYTIDDEIVVDKVYRFEEIPDAMQEVAARVGLPEIPDLPRTKISTRKDKRTYQEFCSATDREKIARIYAKEIEQFDYQW